MGLFGSIKVFTPLGIEKINGLIQSLQTLIKNLPVTSDAKKKRPSAKHIESMIAILTSLIEMDSNKILSPNTEIAEELAKVDGDSNTFAPIVFNKNTREAARLFKDFVEAFKVDQYINSTIVRFISINIGKLLESISKATQKNIDFYDLIKVSESNLQKIKELKADIDYFIIDCDESLSKQRLENYFNRIKELPLQAYNLEELKLAKLKMKEPLLYVFPSLIKAPMLKQLLMLENDLNKTPPNSHSYSSIVYNHLILQVNPEKISKYRDEQEKCVKGILEIIKAYGKGSVLISKDKDKLALMKKLVEDIKTQSNPRPYPLAILRQIHALLEKAFLDNQAIENAKNLSLGEVNEKLATCLTDLFLVCNQYTLESDAELFEEMQKHVDFSEKDFQNISTNAIEELAEDLNEWVSLAH